MTDEAAITGYMPESTPPSERIKYDPKVIPVPLPAEFTENFLIIGESGTGKTRFAGTFPRPYFFDFDKGTRSLGRDFKDYRTFIEAPHGVKPRKGMYEWGMAWPAFYKYHNEVGLRMDKGDWPYDTLVYDSLTTLQEIALSFVLKSALAGGDKARWKPGSSIDPGLWFAQQNLMQHLVGETRGWPGLKIFNAHVQKDVNDMQGTTEKLPLVTGKLAGKLPIYFDEIYFLDFKVDKYVILSSSDALRKSARSRIDVPKDSKQDFLLSVWPWLIK